MSPCYSAAYERGPPPLIDCARLGTYTRTRKTQLGLLIEQHSSTYLHFLYYNMYNACDMYLNGKCLNQREVVRYGSITRFGLDELD